MYCRIMRELKRYERNYEAFIVFDLILAMLLFFMNMPLMLLGNAIIYYVIETIHKKRVGMFYRRAKELKRFS